MAGTETILIYDGDCPFCSNYIRLVKLREAVGPIRLINARDGGPEVREATRQGFDLNEGMLFVLNGHHYHGADCINRLALLSTGSGLFNGITAAAFRSPALSRALYPVLRAGRNLTLRLLRRRPLTESRC